MRKSVTYSILKCTLGYINDQQLHHMCHLITLGIQVRLLILVTSMFKSVIRCMSMLHNGPQVAKVYTNNT